MSNDKQWLWTKIVGILMGLFLLLSSGIGAANMHFDLKRDVMRNEKTIGTHKEEDEKLWDTVHADVRSNTAGIHALELQNTRLETQYLEIMRRLDELNRKLDLLEIIDA